MSELNTMIDQMGFEVNIEAIPKRIISLVPSQTELLFDLGLDKEIVGITKFCVHPKDKIDKITKVGGTKKFRFDVIDDLEPDLILGNKEENYQEGIEKLKERYPVWVSDIETLDGAYDMMLSVGRITGKLKKSIDIVSETKQQFARLTNDRPSKTVLYFIWQEPKMVAGGGTFINHLLEKAGFINLAAQMQRYPELTDDRIKELDPDLILLSSEPFPFAKKHLDDFKQRFPTVNISLVDGELFSWYGSRLRLAPAYFKKMLV